MKLPEVTAFMTGANEWRLFDRWPPKEAVRMGGFQMMLSSDVIRSKFRNSFEKPEPMVPNQLTRIEFELADKLHRFQKGHKMMVQIQSTWESGRAGINSSICLS